MNKTLADDPLLIHAKPIIKKKSYKRLRNMLLDSGKSLKPTSKCIHTKIRYPIRNRAKTTK